MPGSIASARRRGWTRSSLPRAPRVSRPAASAMIRAFATRLSRRTCHCCRRRLRLPDLSVSVAGLELKNSVVAGSGEATADRDAIRAAVASGAAAVVAKSANETEAARAQLRAAEYVLVDERFETRPLGPAARTDSLFCRSGLLDEPWDEWVE